MPSWKHGCFLVEYLIWSLEWMSTSISLSLSRLSRLPFLSALRHVQPAVQLLFLSQLARQLAEQLDCERGCCQPPVFEASVPPSDPQLQKLPVPEVEVLVFHILIMFRLQGVQCLDQCLKKRGTQEDVQFSDDRMLYPCQTSDTVLLCASI